jgi:uncharacterized membrane protein YphA (DoxX/SURF4 family)
LIAKLKVLLVASKVGETMNIALWVVQGLLAAIFLLAGTMKILRSRPQLLANKHMGWVNDFSATQIKLIGLAEVAGALGLILPWAFGIVPILTPVAAFCLALLMGGAALTHNGRSEPLVPPFVLGILALGVVIGRLQTIDVGHAVFNGDDGRFRTLDLDNGAPAREPV